MPRPVFTHFVDYDQPGGRWARALCGALVYRPDAVATPTCPQCQAALTYRDHLVERLKVADERGDA